MPGEPLLRARAWAKINLYLHVLARRDDGYHELDSLIVFAGAGDVLEVEPANKLTLAVRGPFAAGVTGDEQNLVMRAARLLARGAKRRGAAIRLHKHLARSARRCRRRRQAAQRGKPVGRRPAPDQGAVVRLRDAHNPKAH